VRIRVGALAARRQTSHQWRDKLGKPVTETCITKFRPIHLLLARINSICINTHFNVAWRYVIYPMRSSLWFVHTSNILHFVLCKSTGWVKKILSLPLGFCEIFPQLLTIFKQNFTRLLYVRICVKWRNFIHLSLTATKLCHIKCDIQWSTVCSDFFATSVFLRTTKTPITFSVGK